MPLLYIPLDRKLLMKAFLNLLGAQELDNLQIDYHVERTTIKDKDEYKRSNLSDEDIAGFLQALKDQLDDPTYD